MTTQNNDPRAGYWLCECGCIIHFLPHVGGDHHKYTAANENNEEEVRGDCPMCGADRRFTRTEEPPLP